MDDFLKQMEKAQEVLQREPTEGELCTRASELMYSVMTGKENWHIPEDVLQALSAYIHRGYTRYVRPAGEPSNHQRRLFMQAMFQVCMVLETVYCMGQTSTTKNVKELDFVSL